MVKQILTVCGAGHMTSSVVMANVARISEKNSLDIEVDKCGVMEIESKLALKKYDLIISTTQLNKDQFTIPVLEGLPFLTGFNVEELEKEIVEILRN